jgi:hypothetical protein
MRSSSDRDGSLAISFKFLAAWWRKGVLVVCMLLPSFAYCAFAADCGNSSDHATNIAAVSRRSLVSPDTRWKFISIPRNSPDQAGVLYIESAQSSQKFEIGTIERSGTVFWSDDSKRLFLRDSYAADDTKIRVWDVSGPRPTEIAGLDGRIRKAIYARIPSDETTLWLYYPHVCFAAGDSSTIILVANLPVVRKSEGGKGKDFSLTLTVHLDSRQILITGPEAPRFPRAK